MTGFSPSSPRRAVSLFPQRTVDEMDVLGDEQSAWEEQVAAAQGAVDRSKVVDTDGTINWWEALAPLLSMGFGAAVGSSRGALIAGTAGAGYLQGRVEADERFRKQRQINEALAADRADKKLRFALDAAAKMEDFNPDMAADVYLRAMSYLGIDGGYTKEDMLQWMSAKKAAIRKKEVDAQIAVLEGDDASPASIMQAMDLKKKNYKLIFGEDITPEAEALIARDADFKLEKIKTKTDKEAADLAKIRQDITIGRYPIRETDPTKTLERLDLVEGTTDVLRKGVEKPADAAKVPPAVQAKIGILKAVNEFGEKLVNDIKTNAEVQGWMGPGWGRVAEFSSKQLGSAGLPVSVVSFMSGVEDIADQWLRERTGAQANESEISKASGVIMASMRANPQAAVARLRSVMDFNNIKIRQYETGALAPEATPVSEVERRHRVQKAIDELQGTVTEDDGGFRYDPETGLWGFSEE